MLSKLQQRSIMSCQNSPLYTEENETPELYWYCSLQLLMRTVAGWKHAGIYERACLNYKSKLVWGEICTILHHKISGKQWTSQIDEVKLYQRCGFSFSNNFTFSTADSFVLKFLSQDVSSCLNDQTAFDIDSLCVTRHCTELKSYPHLGLFSFLL